MPKEIKPEVNPQNPMKGLYKPTTKRQIAETVRYAVQIAEISYRSVKEFDRKTDKHSKMAKLSAYITIINLLLSALFIYLLLK